jgi:hypothetical protein
MIWIKLGLFIIFKNSKLLVVQYCHVSHLGNNIWCDFECHQNSRRLVTNAHTIVVVYDA